MDGEVEKVLREAERRQSEFLAVLSHELRNPLAPIKNALYLLKRAPAGGEQAKRAHEVIERQVDQLARLVDDLLDVTRISRGKIQLQKGRLELNELLRHVVEDHRAEFSRAGVQLEAVLAPEPLYVNGDATRLAQAVGNVLQNAAKFTPRGGQTMLSLAYGDEGWATIHVRDTGVGIAPEALPRLFEPFAHADKGLDRSQGGLGIGLALAKGLVDLHGGAVSAHSEGIGRGAELVLRLPVEKVATAHLSVVPHPTENGGRGGLIIEDNFDAAESLKEVLELHHHVVDVANTGVEGLYRAHSFRPDIVLCDIGLPLMDGYAVAHAMRADPDLRKVALIALSGYALPEDVERAKEAGFDQHLAKPPDLAALERTLSEVHAQASAS